MHAASTQDTILFNDVPVMLFTGLSHQSLTMRKTLKPLTQLLQSGQMKYQWRVQHNGKADMFRFLGDHPAFLSTLEIQHVSLPNWPFNPTTLGLPFLPQWQKQGC